MVYNDLVEQYNKLGEEEKRVLYVYKSRLGRAINALDNDLDEVKDVYENYKVLLNDPKNLFMKLTVFKSVNFDSLDLFIKSLKEIKRQIMEIDKLTISEDVTVYRTLSVEKNSNLSFLSKSDLISTSFNLDECTKFLILNKNYKHYLYQINLKKGSKVSICPYAILLNSLENQLILTNRRDQEELILEKDLYEYQEKLGKVVDLENGEKLNIIVVDALQKNKNNKK